MYSGQTTFFQNAPFRMEFLTDIFPGKPLTQRKYFSLIITFKNKQTKRKKMLEIALEEGYLLSKAGKKEKSQIKSNVKLQKQVYR